MPKEKLNTASSQTDVIRINKELLLRDALKEELETLPEYNGFGEKNNLNNYREAISYLENKVLPINWEDNDLLYSIIEDFDTICSDYCV